MVEADFPKDEEVVPVSTRASARLIEALEKLGVDPRTPVNALDAAAFLLEAISDAVDQVNSEARKEDFKDLARATVEDSRDVLDGLAAPRQLKLRCGCTMEVPFKPEVGTSYRCPCGKITVVYEGTETAMIPVSRWAPGEDFGAEAHIPEESPGSIKDTIAGLMQMDEGLRKVVDILGEPSEEELGALDEVTHEAGCDIWDGLSCSCDTGDYDHGGEG